MMVVIPSNRMINLNHLSPLIDRGARFVIVDDTEGSIRIDHPQFTVYNWEDRRRMLGSLDVGYPKRNGASRDFGFYIAWQETDPDELVVALDDDCEVYHGDFYDQVEEVLSNRERPVVTCEGDHLNILDLYEGISGQLFPRGFPYAARVNYGGVRFKASESRPVTFCLGMWKGVFDVNAIDKVKGPEYVHDDARLKEPSVIIETEKLISVCSMNMMFRRELIPAVYQLPMHVEVMPNWVIDRYGDIWGGFILKTLMDLKKEAMAVGEPMIRHLRKAGYTTNIWQEHLCHLVNDEFLALLSRAKTAVKPGTYLSMMCVLCDAFERSLEDASPILRPYLENLCTALTAWTESLSK